MIPKLCVFAYVQVHLNAVEPRYNEDIGTMTLGGFCYIRPLYL